MQGSLGTLGSLGLLGLFGSLGTLSGWDFFLKSSVFCGLMGSGTLPSASSVPVVRMLMLVLIATSVG